MTLTKLTLKRMGDFEVKKDEYYNDVLVAWYEIPELRGMYVISGPDGFTRFETATAFEIDMFKYIPENYLDHWIFVPDRTNNAFEFIHSFGNKYGIDIDYHFRVDYNGSRKNTPYCVKVTCNPQDLEKLTRFINDLNKKFEEFERLYYEKEQKRVDEELQKKCEWEASETYKRINECNTRFPEEIK